MMKERNGRLIDQPNSQDRLLARLYGSAAGRMLLRPLVCPVVSRAAGAFLSTRLSALLIKPFIRSAGIDMSQYEPGPYHSYNEFFSRKILPGKRPFDMDPGHLIAPCDSKLTALPISPDSVFTIKHTSYTVASLLRDDALARKYTGGHALIFRLTVDDYHRYCYAADGNIDSIVRIPGVLHTVNPIAGDYYPIYKENAREYAVLHSPVFGDVLTMEVGALLVGRIVNHRHEGAVARGQEKGYFQFGGSTVILLLPRDAVRIDDDILANSRDGVETVVRMGEKIGSQRA